MNHKVKVLREAKRILMECGWCQENYAKGLRKQNVGTYSADAQSFCIVGAIKRAHFNLLGKGINFSKSVQNDWGINKDALFSLNDGEFSTKEMVIDKLKSLIKENT